MHTANARYNSLSLAGLAFVSCFLIIRIFDDVLYYYTY